MLPERLILLSTAQGLEFSDVPGGSIPEWTIDDLGMALTGLDTLYFKAFTYRWAADFSSTRYLQGELFAESRKLAKREKWPEKMADRLYVLDLVDMCLLEEQHPHIFRVSCLWPAVMDVEMPVWTRFLSSKYEAVRMIFEGWTSVAHSHMLQRLLDCEELG